MKKFIIVLLSLINLRRSQLAASPPPLTEEDIMLMEELRKINPNDPILLQLEKELAQQNMKPPNAKPGISFSLPVTKEEEMPMLVQPMAPKNENKIILPNETASSTNNNNMLGQGAGSINNNNTNNNNTNNSNMNNNNQNNNNMNNNNQNNNNQNNNNQNNNNQNNKNQNNNMNNDNIENQSLGPEYPFNLNPSTPQALMLSLITGQGDIFDNPQNTQSFITLFSGYMQFLNNLENNQWNLQNGIYIDSCTALTKMSPIAKSEENLRLCVPMHIYSSNSNMMTCFIWACINFSNQTFFYRICTKTVPFNRNILNLDNYGPDYREFEKTINPQTFMSDTWFAIDRILNCRNPVDLMKGLQIVSFFGGDITWNE